MAKPAGVQIRRWFFFLMVLLVGTNAGVLAGSWLVERAVTEAVRTAQPVVDTTGRIRAEILEAQREMFRYLAEFSDDVSDALAHLERVRAEVERARALPGARGMDDDLQAIEKGVEQYRKVLELLPAAAGGTRDWSRIQEYGSTAVRLGDAARDRAERLAQRALETIDARGNTALLVARGARWAAAATLGISVLTVIALARWWRRFQDVILGF